MGVKKGIMCIGLPDAITIHYCDVQWQSGYNDCGLFAIAFAASLCAGESPTNKTFDQSAMREHLKKCFITGNLSPFPERINRRKRAIKVASQETVPIYCLCRLPYGGEKMVHCEACHQWYHPDCAQIPRKYLSKKCKSDYICKDCVQ